MIFSIDPDTYGLSAGRWIITFEAKKKGYINQYAQSVIDITYGIEIFEGENVISITDDISTNTTIILTMYANTPFWLVIEQLAEPTNTELQLNSSYRPVPGTFFKLSAYTLEPYNGALFSYFQMEIVVANLNINPQAIIVYFSGESAWDVKQTTFTDFSLLFELEKLGAIGLVMSEQDLYNLQLNNSPGFEIFAIIGIILIAIFRLKKKRLT
jgi:hypothetical protein